MFIYTIISKVFNFIFPGTLLKALFQHFGHLLHLGLIGVLIYFALKTANQMNTLMPESKTVKYIALVSHLAVYLLTILTIILIKLHMLMGFLKWI